MPYRQIHIISILLQADGEKLPRERAIIRGGNLTIKGLRKEDHGRFECVLENEIATLVTSTLLLVEGKTHYLC